MIRLFLVVFFWILFFVLIRVGCMLKKGRVVELGLRLIVLVSGEIRMLLVLVCY